MVIYQRVTSNIYATETRTKPAEIILLILQFWGFFSIYSYTYKINYFTFVFSGPRCPNVLKNCQFINCQYNIGDSCSYKCNYPFEVNPSVKKLTCDKDGEWSHDTNVPGTRMPEMSVFRTTNTVLCLNYFRFS